MSEREKTTEIPGKLPSNGSTSTSSSTGACSSGGSNDDFLFLNKT